MHTSLNFIINKYYAILRRNESLKLRVTEIPLFVFSGAIRKVFWIDCVNIYFSQSIVMLILSHLNILVNRSESVRLPHIAYIVIR